MYLQIRDLARKRSAETQFTTVLPVDELPPKSATRSTATEGQSK